MKDFDNIIQIKGLCGSGKTTISKILAKKLKAKILRIGSYRRKNRNEFDSWDLFVEDIKKYSNKYPYVIIETTGINFRESLLEDFPKNKAFYLDAELDILKMRIKKKPIWNRGYFNFLNYKIFHDYKDKYDFNKKNFEIYQKRKLSGIIINANKNPKIIAKDILEYI